MYDILVTIWDGLPMLAIFMGIAFIIFCIIYLYLIALSKLIKDGYVWTATFLITIPLFLFISILSYVLGRL